LQAWQQGSGSVSDSVSGSVSGSISGSVLLVRSAWQRNR